ncbi:hypothetical protein E1A91_1Z022300v1 [Gossypium mustelinum]|uniref:Uncharacterized protein n=1 Tax=Gossypium mustelinum TaxID=34275 RepID=A0A5C7J275_GOSMU|nr:hypothetical protein E1A91_1Z022300v1 [Gossypium mustelinum]
MLSNQLRHATPGLGIALVAFGIYLVGSRSTTGFMLLPPLIITNNNLLLTPIEIRCSMERTQFGHGHVSVSLCSCCNKLRTDIKRTCFKFDY